MTIYSLDTQEVYCTARSWWLSCCGVLLSSCRLVSDHRHGAPFIISIAKLNIEGQTDKIKVAHANTGLDRSLRVVLDFYIKPTLAWHHAPRNT